MTGPPWVQVWNCAWLHEAHFLGSVLESADIPYQIPDEYTVGVQPLLATVLGGIRILVRPEDLARARELLQSAEPPARDAHPGDTEAG